MVSSEILFSKNLHHIETSQLTGLNIIRFLMQSVSEQILITDNAVNCRIILVLYGLNRTNQGY